MADKKQEKEQAKPQVPKKSKKMVVVAPDGKLTKAQVQLLLVSIFSVGGIFMPTTIMLLIGLLPTMVAFFVQKGTRKIRVLTIGAMNFAGCVPFLLELWLEGHSFERSFDIIFDPRTIVVMYGCAAIGYIIDWAITGFIASILYERGTKRKEEMQEYQDQLVKRWGEKVTGIQELDEDGFPYDNTKV